MSAHTPGPWIAVVTTRRGNHQGGFSIEADGCVIAGRAGWPDRFIESSANAALIAAAPDLQSCAQYLMEAVEETKFDVFIGTPTELQRIKNALEKVRAAIAKSKGPL